MLLTTMNNMVQYQYEGNVHLVYAILRRKEIFYKLARLTLPRAIRDIRQLQKQDYYKSFAGGESKIGSTISAGSGSGSSIGDPSQKRTVLGVDSVDSDVISKMALTTSPTDLISTTLEERDISGNVRKGKFSSSQSAEVIPGAPGNLDMIDVNLARMASSFSVLDRTGSFVGELNEDQKRLNKGEGFIDDNEKIESTAAIDLDSSHGAGSSVFGESDDEFESIEVLALKKNSDESHNAEISNVKDRSATENEDDEEDDEDDESFAMPGEKRTPPPLAVTAVPSKEIRPILNNEKKAQDVSQRLKASLSVVGKKDRFVPDKVYILQCKI